MHADKHPWLAATDLGAVTVAAPTLLLPGRWTAAGVAVIAASWVMRYILAGRLSRRTPLDLPILLLVGMGAIGFAVSPVPQASAREVCGLLLGASLYYALANRDFSVRSTAAAHSVVILGLVVALVALVHTYWSAAPLAPFPVLDAIYPKLLSLAGRISLYTRALGPLFNPRQLGGVVCLTLPPAAVLILFDSKAHIARRLGLALVACGLTVLALLSQSVSALGGLLLATWLVAVIRDVRRRAWWLGLGIVGTIAAAGLALVTLGAPFSAIQRIAATSRPQPGLPHAAFGVESRFEIWERAVQMIHDSPYTGIGPGSFPWVMDRFYPGFSLGPQPHAHNLVLEAAVDFGVVGLGAFIWLIAAFALSLIAVYRRSSSAGAQVSALAIGSGFFAYLVFGTIDVITLGAPPGLLLWAALGLGVALSPPAQQPFSDRRLSAIMAALVLITLLAPFFWDGPRLNAGRTLAQRALLFFSGSPSQTEELTRAAPYLEHALQQDPSNTGSWYLLASSLAALGKQPAAIAALERGVTADSHAPLLRYSALRGFAQPEASSDWPGLQQVYLRWMTRYPRQGIWYVAAAIAACEGQGNTAAASSFVTAGLGTRAQPEGLLLAYRAQLQHCP